MCPCKIHVAQAACSAVPSSCWAFSWLIISPCLSWFNTAEQQGKKCSVIIISTFARWWWCTLFYRKQHPKGLWGLGLWESVHSVPGVLREQKSLYWCTRLFETFSNTSLLFPLKDFMGLPVHHILHSLPYWLLKVALNTRPPSSSFTGCWGAGKLHLAVPVLAELPRWFFQLKWWSICSV